MLLDRLPLSPRLVPYRVCPSLWLLDPPEATCFPFDFFLSSMIFSFPGEGGAVGGLVAGLTMKLAEFYGVLPPGRPSWWRKVPLFHRSSISPGRDMDRPAPIVRLPLFSPIWPISLVSSRRSRFGCLTTPRSGSPAGCLLISGFETTHQLFCLILSLFCLQELMEHLI